MSDKVPNNGFENIDPDEFRFPADEPERQSDSDELPDEVLNFSFDGTDADLIHLREVPPEEARERRVDAVIASFRRMAEERADRARPAEDEEPADGEPAGENRVNAVFDALRRRAKRAEEPAGDAGNLEEKLADAMRGGQRREKTAERRERERPAARAPGDARMTPERGTPRPAAPSRAAKERTPKERTPRERTPAVVPERRPAPKKRAGGGPRFEPAPVTIGRPLRGEQMLVYDSELDEVDYTDEEDLPEARDYMPIRFGRFGRLGIGGGLLYALFVISASIVLACLLWMFASDVLALNKEPGSAIVTIEQYEPGPGEPATTLVGETEQPIKVDIDQVATELKNNGMIEYKWLFKLFSQFSHADTKIDPGTYDVSTELDYRALVTSLQFGSGKQEVTRITFPEGYTIEQTFTLLEENQICRREALYEAAANYDFSYDFVEELEKGDENRLEGYLFPDTYDFYQGEDATVSISRFLRNLNGKLTAEMRDAAAARGMSVRELLTLASLIEKEAGSDTERPIIASVIYNRLNVGMPLQLDSTINYIKNTSTFNLTTADTEIDDPYNTYMYEGLPPGPICSPGLASIVAALNPANTDYWYWYAVDGQSYFFTNYDDFKAFGDAHPYD